MDFKGIGEVTFEKLPITRINEAAELIHYTYKEAGIWLKYTKEEATEELLCSFSNLIYKPTFYIALHDDKIIGLASYMWSHCSANILELSFGTVHPYFQRKGIGNYLTYIRLKEIVENNDHALIIVVARIPELFEKFNFKTICKIKNELQDADYMTCMGSEINFGNYMSDTK
jgi:N-acetylglutamate synthase-like GNAT family acetyltransferase